MPIFGSNFDWVTAFALLVGLILGTTVHEAGHATAALLLGDHTAQRMGRVTLNPVAHFDPVGFILMVMLAFGSFGFAWGKPTPVNPSALAGGRKGSSVVSLAGPFANILIASIFAILIRVIHPDPNTDLGKILESIFLANILLFSFNLIPIPPLDGFGLVSGLVSDSWYRLMAPVYKYGIPILLVVAFLLPQLLPGFNILDRIISPVRNLVVSIMLGYLGA